MIVFILAVLAISVNTTPVHANWFEKWGRTERLDTAQESVTLGYGAVKVEKHLT